MLKSRGLLAAVLAALFLFVAVKTFLNHSTNVENARSSTTIGGAFELTDQDGQQVTEKDLLGQPSVMFFGYMYCPDICPTTLLELTNWLKALGADADKLNTIFVSVDSSRDTPKQMKLYLSSFDPHIRGFTGRVTQIRKVTSEYHVYYKRVQLDGGDYVYDHSALIYLMDQNGRYVGIITPNEHETTAIGKLRGLIK